MCTLNEWIYESLSSVSWIVLYPWETPTYTDKERGRKIFDLVQEKYLG